MTDIPAVPPNARWFAVEYLDEVTVLRFIRPDMGGGEAAKAIDGPLGRLVDDMGLRHFVLDFAPVGRVSSAVLGKLIGFHKKVKKAGGRLTLCSLRPDLHTQFERTKLNTIFSICPTEREALEGVRGEAPAAGDETPLPAALRRPHS